MPDNPLRHNVPGAPFAIGQQVEVVRLLDDTASRRCLHKVGTIEYYEYDCGCGQNWPDDPMIGVRFATGRVHEFWRCELSRASPPPAL